MKQYSFESNNNFDYRVEEKESEIPVEYLKSIVKEGWAKFIDNGIFSFEEIWKEYEEVGDAGMIAEFEYLPFGTYAPKGFYLIRECAGLKTNRSGKKTYYDQYVIKKQYFGVYMRRFLNKMILRKYDFWENPAFTENYEEKTEFSVCELAELYGDITLKEVMELKASDILERWKNKHLMEAVRKKVSIYEDCMFITVPHLSFYVDYVLMVNGDWDGLVEMDAEKNSLYYNKLTDEQKKERLECPEMLCFREWLERRKA